MQKLKTSFNRLNLAQQTILLVAVLLCSELAFAITLTCQLHAAQQETKREAHLSEVFIRSETIVIGLVDYIRAMETYATSRSEPDLARSKESQKAIQDNLKWLKEKLKNDAELSDEIMVLWNQYKKFFKIVDYLETRVSSMSQAELVPFFGAVLQKINPLRYSIERNSVKLLHEEERLLRALPEKQAATRERVRCVIIGGLVLNALIMLILTVFFVKRIGGKVAILTDNTRRLSSNITMNPPLEGSDELARLDRAMHDMADSIKQAQAERQELLATVNHELRTPLGTVRSTIEMMSMGIFGDLPAQLAANTAQSQIELDRLLSLINDLLDLEKMEAGKMTIIPERVTLDEILEAARLAVLKRASEKSIEISIEESEAVIKADRDRLTQVFINLLVNAISHSPSGSMISVIPISEAESSTVKVQVSDEGNGVPEALRASIMQRFRRLNDSDEGIVCGMGLPICAHLIKLHGGQISYCPGEIRGSVFTVILPQQV